MSLLNVGQKSYQSWISFCFAQVFKWYIFKSFVFFVLCFLCELELARVCSAYLLVLAGLLICLLNRKKLDQKILIKSDSFSLSNTLFIKQLVEVWQPQFISKVSSVQSVVAKTTFETNFLLLLIYFIKYLTNLF
jgi:hypothetical protein